MPTASRDTSVSQTPPHGGTRNFHNPAYLQSSLTLLLFFASWGIWWSFFQIWLTNPDSGLGLNGAQVGRIYAINSIATLILMLGYGTLQDRLGLKKTLAIGTAVIQTLVGPFAVWLYRPLLESYFTVGVILGAIVLSAGFMSAVGMLEALAEKFSRAFDLEYGQARMWGSFGYAAVALAAGFLFTVNPELNFWLGSAFGLANLLVLILWPTPVARASAPIAGDGAPESTPGLRDMGQLLANRDLWMVILLVLFTWTFYTVFDQQMFPDFYTGLFDTKATGEQAYGVLNSIQVFLEAAMMGLVPILMRKIGVRATLLCGFGVMFVRIGGCAVLDGPVAISLIKMLHAPEVALCVLPIFRYFTLHFNPALSATLYMIGFNITSQVGVVILSPGLGSLRDAIGYQPTFLVIAAIVGIAAVFGCFTLRRDDQAVRGEPFARDTRRHTPRTPRGGDEHTTAAE